MPRRDTVDVWRELPNFELLRSRNHRHPLGDDFQEHHEFVHYLIVSDVLQKSRRRALVRLGQKDGMTRHADRMASKKVIQKLREWWHGEWHIGGDQGTPGTRGRHHREDDQAEHEGEPAALPD